jgi:hypothetical protein
MCCEHLCFVLRQQCVRHLRAGYLHGRCRSCSLSGMSSGSQCAHWRRHRLRRLCCKCKCLRVMTALCPVLPEQNLIYPLCPYFYSLFQSGKYSSIPGALTCQQCAAGKLSVQVGGVLIASCDDCPVSADSRLVCSRQLVSCSTVSSILRLFVVFLRPALSNRAPVRSCASIAAAAVTTL